LDHPLDLHDLGNIEVAIQRLRKDRSKERYDSQNLAELFEDVQRDIMNRSGFSGELFI
jgi:hypothetical protein